VRFALSNFEVLVMAPLLAPTMVWFVGFCKTLAMESAGAYLMPIFGLTILCFEMAIFSYIVTIPLLLVLGKVNWKIKIPSPYFLAAAVVLGITCFATLFTLTWLSFGAGLILNTLAFLWVACDPNHSFKQTPKGAA
jgi:hypothetical protein